jgi:Tfp pilus assembly protein PilO
VGGDFTFKRQLILGILGILLASDAGLIAYSAQNSSGSKVPQRTLALETERLKLLKADVERAQKLSKVMPAIREDCDRFEKSLPQASVGYSTVVAELGEIAKKAGVRIEGVGFREKEIQNKPFSQVSLEATVNGTYTNVVRFLNGLQRAKGLYIVSELGLGAGSQYAGGSLRVNLHMQTYFRTRG